MALSIRDGEDNVVFDNAMMTQHGLNYGLANIGGFTWRNQFLLVTQPNPD
jgi:hypothetical protein